MIVFKVILSLNIFGMILFAHAGEIKKECPSKTSNEYISEALNLITSGFSTGKSSSCLKQNNYKLFDLSLTDEPDSTKRSFILLSDDVKTSVIKKEFTELGNLRITFSIIDGKKNLGEDSFELYFHLDKGCAAFFGLPKNSYLKKSCVQD